MLFEFSELTFVSTFGSIMAHSISGDLPESIMASKPDRTRA